MTTRGYKNIAEKYFMATGLRHSKLQLKNRLDILKGLYAFWLQLLKDNGLGWNQALGTVVATDEYWDRVTKVWITFWLAYLFSYRTQFRLTILLQFLQGHSQWKQLKKGPPEHEELLHEMFGSIVVDGSTACAPSEVLGQ